MPTLHPAAHSQDNQLGGASPASPSISPGQVGCLFLPHTRNLSKHAPVHPWPPLAAWAGARHSAAHTAGGSQDQTPPPHDPAADAPPAPAPTCSRDNTGRREGGGVLIPSLMSSGAGNAACSPDLLSRLCGTCTFCHPPHSSLLSGSLPQYTAQPKGKHALLLTHPTHPCLHMPLLTRSPARGHSPAPAPPACPPSHQTSTPPSPGAPRVTQ